MSVPQKLQSAEGLALKNASLIFPFRSMTRCVLRDFARSANVVEDENPASSTLLTAVVA